MQLKTCDTCSFCMSCRPDLLLVERSVARSAQEELLQRGIALVQHTKPELLERLGRCMGVKVRSRQYRHYKQHRRSVSCPCTESQTLVVNALCSLALSYFPRPTRVSIPSGARRQLNS
jgi:hypothetical protein